MTTRAVIVAGGDGSRMDGVDPRVPKPLLRLGDRTIIERVIENAVAAGITEFAVVTRHLADQFPPVIDTIAGRLRVPITCVNLNERFPGDPVNDSLAMSIVRGFQALPEESDFILLMGDHIGDPSIIAALRDADPGDGIVLAVEQSRGRTPLQMGYGPDSLSKVLVDDRGRVRSVGKSMQDYNGFDTGFFLFSAEATRWAAEHLARMRTRTVSSFELQDLERVLAACGRMGAVDIGTARWRNINTPAEYAQAEATFIKGPSRKIELPRSRRRR